MSGSNPGVFKKPFPVYKGSSNVAETNKNPSNAGYINPYSLPPPPPPPTTASTETTPTYSSSYNSYNPQDYGINVQNLNQTCSYLNYQQNSATNSQNIPQNQISTSQPYTAHPPNQSYTIYAVRTPHYTGIAYPPPLLPTSNSQMQFSPNVPPPNLQFGVNPAGYFMHGQAGPPMMRPRWSRPNNNGYLRNTNGYNLNLRKRPGGLDWQIAKQTKKRKRPLSQAVPVRKDWSVADAVRALKVESEVNKLHKSPSLIIKFPDLELNRDIVLKFNSKIDTVHFQQPSTARYCFVTLHKDADCEKVIKQLNETKFGVGYLSAEYKKERDETENVGPEDIDPLTLYVGNLAQEVTVEDVHKAYPKHKRVDIGFAKKMKFTRYAFVCFKNVDDAIEAFQNTHATEMYNKSIIVRFRRLHGTVGLPGEIKQHNSRRNDTDKPKDSADVGDASANSSISGMEEDDEVDHQTVMHSYIARVKEENPNMDENEDWYYSEEEESYDPMPDWFNGINTLRDQRLLANERADSNRDLFNASLLNTPKIEIKSEPDSIYDTSQNRLQPVIEHVHQPILEPKIERNQTSTAGVFRNSPDRVRNESLEIDRLLIEPKREMGNVPNETLELHRPMLEPKVERTEVPSQTDGSRRLKEPPQAVKNSKEGFGNPHELLEQHRPMLEPKVERTDISSNLGGSRGSKERFENPHEPLEQHRPMLEPKVERTDISSNSGGLRGLKERFENPYESVELHRPMLEPKVEKTEIPNNLGGCERLTEPLQEVRNSNNPHDSVELHRPMLEPKIERQDVLSDPKETSGKAKEFENPYDATLKKRSDDFGSENVRKESVGNQKQGLELDQIHKPMLEPKLEPPSETTPVMITNTSHEYPIITSFQPIKIKTEFDLTDGTDKIHKNKDKNFSSVKSPADINVNFKDKDAELEIKKEKVDEDASKIQEPDEDESSSDEGDDLSNFLSNIKTGKSFLL